MVRVGWVMEVTFFLCLFVAGRAAPTLQDERAGDSPPAISVEDPHLSQDAIFSPVPSCLSEVILVIYVQSLELLNRLELYKDMYGPFVREIDIYVDGTWCDPRARNGRSGVPCYGPRLNRSALPKEVRVVDHNGGGWLMQRSLIDAIQRPREKADPAGFLFITDDVLLNLGQLTRAVRVSGCDVIWRSDHAICEDVKNKGKHDRVFDRFLSEARNFSQFSDERFNDQLARNLGSSSTFCMGSQNDFIYIPSGMATAWTKVAQQMTDLGLVFTFTFNSAIYGIAPMEDMVVLRTHYLSKESRADKRLEGQRVIDSPFRFCLDDCGLSYGARFDGESEPYCWTGKGNVSEILGMHIIHPNKIAFSETSWDFALTLNPPGAGVNIGISSLESSAGLGVQSITEATAASGFWCSK